MKGKTKSTEMDLLHGAVGETLLRFSFPFMLSTLLQTLYATTDTIIVGQFLGSAGLSAVSNGSQLMQMLYMICIGFATAGQVLIAQAKGAGKTDKIREVVGSLFLLEIGLSVLIGSLCVLLYRQMLSLLNTPAEAIRQAGYYTVICGAGMVFTGLYNLFSAVLRGLGDSRHPLLFVVIASLCNIVLDILFIAVFHWNVAGAALATVIGQCISVVFSIRFFGAHGELLGFPFRMRELHMNRTSAAKILKLGIPLAIQSSAIQFSFLFVSHMVNTLGVDVSAAFGVSQKLRNVPGILTQGLGLGCSSMIGQNWGAGDLDRVDKTIRWGIRYSTIINVLFGLLFWLAPTFCFRLFTPDPTVLSFARMCTIAMIAELPAKFFMNSCNALVSAQGAVRFSFVIAFLDAFAGRMFLCWFLGVFLNIGAFGFFMGYTMGTYLTAIPVLIYYLSGMWKRKTRLA